LRESGFYGEHGIAEPDLRDYLDLVGLATVCDVVPLSGVNRAFVRLGLGQLSKLSRPGLAALAGVAKASPPFTTHHLGFVFGPRINAGGRVGRSSLGADLLSTHDHGAAAEFAIQLDLHNRGAPGIERLILEEAMALAATQDNVPFLLVTNDGWHPGVVGIVAGRLKERFAKPAFVAGFEGGMGTRLGPLYSRHRSRPHRARRPRTGSDRSGWRPCHGGGVFADGKSAFAISPILACAIHRRRAGLRGSRQPGGGRDRLAGRGGPRSGRRNRPGGPYGAGNPEPVLAFPDLRVAFADVVGAAHVKVRLVGGDGARLDAIAFRQSERPW